MARTIKTLATPLQIWRLSGCKFVSELENFAGFVKIIMGGAGVTLHGDADKAHIYGTLTLNVSKIIMRVKGGLEFTNLNGSVTTDSAIADKLDLSLLLKGIKIKGLNLCGMKIPEIEVAI